MIDVVAAAIARLRGEGFTGSLTLHFQDGNVRTVEEKRMWKIADPPVTLDSETKSVVQLRS